MRLKSIVRLGLSVATCLGVGIVGSLVTRPEIPTWYADIIKLDTAVLGVSRRVDDALYLDGRQFVEALRRGCRMPDRPCHQLQILKP